MTQATKKRDKWDDITWALLEELRIQDINGDPDPEEFIAAALRDAYAQGKKAARRSAMRSK